MRGEENWRTAAVQSVVIWHLKRQNEMYSIV